MYSYILEMMNKKCKSVTSIEALSHFEDIEAVTF